MPVPINSLQDLLTIRELKNQANPTYSAIQALSEGVAMGIKEQQEAAKKKKQQEEELANSLKMAETINTQSDKLGVRLKPSTSIKDGKVSVEYKEVDTMAREKEDRLAKRQEEMLKQQKLRNASNLRTEFEKLPQVKDFVTVSTNVNAMEGLLNKSLSAPSEENMVAVDQGLITMYNKLTDPQSVVRESEYARTPGNLPVVNRILGAINKVQQGGAGLTNDDRKALVEGAKIILKERAKPYNDAINDYTMISSEYELDPKLVIKGMQPYEENSYEFNNEQEAISANLPKGTVIYIKGRKAVVE